MNYKEFQAQKAQISHIDAIFNVLQYTHDETSFTDILVAAINLRIDELNNLENLTCENLSIVKQRKSNLEQIKNRLEY